MTVAVRPAVPADLERVAEIAAQSSAGAQWPRKEYERALSPDYARYRLVLVISVSERVQGFIIGRLAGDEWEIENIAIEVQRQRRGLGRRLLHEFLTRAQEHGTAVFLEVRESNAAARKLYEAMGFVQTGRRKSYYREPEEDAILLKISLPAPPQF
jgi:[ribosomal protein S18]-alanine N-acetyltransferase